MRKLTVKEKMGYGSAALGDSAVYTLTGTFLIFFFTTVAGIQPAVAGTISAIGAICNAVLNPIIGYITDHIVTKWGRRRPFMFLMAVPLFASTTLLFTAFHMDNAFKPIYYGLILIVFWCSYTAYFVPYLALGAEYTDDYNERTSLRSYASFFNMVGTVIAMAVPPMLVEILEEKGISIYTAWGVTGGIIGLCAAVSILITAIVAKDKDIYREEEKGQKPKIQLKTIFGEYLELLTLKPMRSLLMVSLLFLISYIMFVSDLVYFITYNHGMTGSESSSALLVRALAGIAIIPAINYIAQKLDKRKAFFIVLTFVCIVVILFRITGIPNRFLLYVFIVATVTATGAYWQLVPAMYYDVCEYDQLITGKKRQGSIVSFQGLTEALASAVGAQLLGIILQMAGFQGEAALQSENALLWIENSITIVPVIFMVGAMVAMHRYEITKDSFKEMREKLVRREENEEI